MGIDAVEASAGEERNEDGIDGCAIVAADEEPVSTTEDLPAQVELADVVVCGEAAVVEETAEGDALIARVLQRGLDGRLVEHARQLGVAPLEKPIDDGAALGRAARAPSLFGRVRDGPLDAKESTNVRQRHLCSVGI